MWLSYLFFLIWFIYLIASSILLFTKGFLLTKESQKYNSTCLNLNEIPCSLILNQKNDSQRTCSTKAKLDKIFNNINNANDFCLPARGRVILLIVDALRYDFTLYDKKLKKPLPFQNKLPIINKMLNNFPQNTRLYKFIADPPTTTMQRLKGLTTGSLPTFIDAGSNFASPEIAEDNLIDQVIRNQKNAIFMGDDTWSNLYPGRFLRSYPFPSFNVKDLDTVDKGVLKNLYPELKKTDWNLLIGHFLGVDHCGHRYGPNHFEMSRKLTEMNEMIENVAELMDDDMILYLLGDHGMTITGDHGGGTELEVSSALFVYSKMPLLNLSKNSKIVKQVNLVPTISTVLGIPIPFSNLGVLIYDAIPYFKNVDFPQWNFSLFALWSNVEQVMEYMQTYAKFSSTFDADQLKEHHDKYALLKSKIYGVTNEESFEQFLTSASELLQNIRLMCEEVWIQFDAFSITRGLLLLFLSLFFVFILSDGIPSKYIMELFLSSFLKCSYIALILAAISSGALYYFDIISNLLSWVMFSTGVVSQFMFAMLVIQNWDTISLTWHSKSNEDKILSYIYRFILAFSLCGLFSNSFIIEEASILLYLSVTVAIFGILNISKNTLRNKSASKWNRYKFLLFSLGISILLRLSTFYWKCRDEQSWCFLSSSINKEGTKSTWAFSVICLALFVTITKTWLKNSGSLNGYSLTISFVKYAPTAIIVCTGGYWVLQQLPNKNRYNSDHFAWAVYFLTIFGSFCLVLDPLLIYILPKKNISGEVTTVIPDLFKKIKGLFNNCNGKNNVIPIIYGLGTVYSSVYLVIGIYFALFAALVLGASNAPSIVIMFLTAVFIAVVISSLRLEKAVSVDDLFDVPNIAILIWVITSHYFFYGSGHQPSLSNIDWNSALVGTTSILNYNFIPGTLVVVNTFCSYILMGFLLPLLFIAPFTMFVMIPSVIKKNKDLHKDLISQGEMILFEKSDQMITSVFTLCCKYLICHAIRVFASMMAATIHCRHLMLWTIFAPKFIFEGLGMFVTLASVLLSYLLLLRINRKVEHLILRLNKTYS